jgi:hypothetical protein
MRNRKVSSRNDALLDSVEGVYRTLESALGAVWDFKTNIIQDGVVWLYDGQATRGEVMQDLRGEKRLASVVEVR